MKRKIGYLIRLNQPTSPQKVRDPKLKGFIEKRWTNLYLSLEEIIEAPSERIIRKLGYPSLESFFIGA